MYLLIIEQEAGGHHMTPYVRFMVRGAAKRGWKVRLLTAEESKGHPALDIVAAELGGELSVSYMQKIAKSSGTGAVSLFYNQLQYYKIVAQSFKELCKDEVPDFVFVMNFEMLDKAIPIFGTPFGSVPFSGMIVNVKFHRFQQGIGPASRKDKIYKKLVHPANEYLKEKTCKWT